MNFKRKVLSFLFFALFPTYLMADPGPAYIFYVEVSYENEKVRGYMSLPVLAYNSGDSILKSDRLFTKFILNYSFEDSLSIYKDIYHIDSLDLTIFLKIVY